MAAYVPSMADPAVQAKTGKTWDEWFRILDKAGARKMPHKDIALLLSEKHGVPDWWCQMVTVEYERARGLREVGMKGDGAFEVSAQRTVALPLDGLMAMWMDGRKRARWLTQAPLASAFSSGAKKARTSTTKMGEVVRVPLPLGEREQLVELTFSEKAAGKAVVRLQHTKIPGKTERDRLKAAWGDALDALVVKAS